jgi:hypothetical protein
LRREASEDRYSSHGGGDDDEPLKRGLSLSDGEEVVVHQSRPAKRFCQGDARRRGHKTIINQ